MGSVDVLETEGVGARLRAVRVRYNQPRRQIVVESGLGWAARTAERVSGFTVQSHRVELIGRCAQCAHRPALEPVDDEGPVR